MTIVGDMALHSRIVLAAAQRGFHLRDLYYFAWKECRKFSMAELLDDQLARIAEHVENNKPPALKTIETELCNCGGAPHSDRGSGMVCTYQKLIKASGD